MDKAEIREKALELFRRVSYAKTSVSDIADACGVAKGTLYLYYESKEAILLAVVEEKSRENARAAEAGLSDRSVPFAARLDSFVRLQVDEYFYLKELMFGNFENVRGTVLQDVVRRCGHLYDGNKARLYELARAEESYAALADERLRAAAAELMELVLGRMFVFLILHDWTDKDGLKDIVAPMAARLFDALAGASPAGADA